METTIKDGKIECKLYGSIMAIDCGTLQGKSCTDCFIYSALGAEYDCQASFSLEKKEFCSEMNKEVN